MMIRKGLFALISTLLFFSGFAQDRDPAETVITRSEVIAQNGMIATSQPLATQVGLDILKKGGSAIDAAIAANAMLGLVEPDNCGIGGDLFAIVWDAKTQKLYGLNASGRAPYDLSIDHFQQLGLDKVPPRSPLAVSVPGAVDGWFELNGRFGKLPMGELLKPAIEYARKGFPVSEVIARWWKEGEAACKGKEGFSAVFLPDGQAPVKGQIFKNPSLADSYELIAQEGREAFYGGEIAEIIEEFLRELGGKITVKDFTDHTSTWVDPVSVNYRGYDVYELPPNGQGLTALQMLTIIEKFDVSSMEFGSPEHLHLLTEAKKLAFEDRAKYYADPDFNKIPVDQLISETYAGERAKWIKPEESAFAYPSGDLEGGETIYLTAADSEGNMISLIQSNSYGFGSCYAPPELGFVLQNRGAMFSLDKEHANALAPHKRPFHTIIPAFIMQDGKPLISFGLMGGAMQPQGHAQIVMNLVDFGMGLQEAGDAPRMRHVGSSQPWGYRMVDGGTLYLEKGFSDATVEKLRGYGHKIPSSGGFFGGYQAIMIDSETGVYFGASESRKDGQAAGY